MVDREKLAKIISIVLGPLIWFPLLIYLFSFKTDIAEGNALKLFLILFLFQLFLPLVVLFYFIWTKRISDWDVRNRKERFKLLPAFIASTLIALAFTYYLGTPLTFNLYLTLWIVALVAAVVTYLWKISLHLSLNTAAVIMVNYLFDWKLPLLYLCVPIISWSRYYLKHHSVLQIIAGISMSGMIALGALKFFGYI